MVSAYYENENKVLHAKVSHLLTLIGTRLGLKVCNCVT